MDVLKKLFEEHFHASPERIQPLQGELGGSGRKIIRLAREKLSAIGISGVAGFQIDSHVF